MPRFHFHTQDGRVCHDKEGTELPDVHRARLEAIRISCEMLRIQEETFWDSKSWQMTVTDATGLVLFVIDVTAHLSPAMNASLPHEARPAAQ
jgi:hypothetical protein